MRLYDVADHVTKEQPDPDPGRSPGLHVSDLVESLATKLGYLDPQGWDKYGTLRAEIGQAWEDRLGAHLERKLPCFCYHPGELHKDGIAGTPDGEEITDDGLLIHEIKLTWIGLGNPFYRRRPGLIPWYWEAQIKAYCHMAQTRNAILHRVYLNEAYKPPRPVYWALGMEFTRQELERHWEMMRREAGKRTEHADIDWESYPVRHCRTLHTCRVCRERITIGDKYYDGGYKRRAHVDCARSSFNG